MILKQYKELENGCGGVWENDGKIYVISAKMDCIYELNEEKGLIKVSNILPKEYESGEQVSFHRIINDGENAFFIPRDANVGLRYMYSNNSFDSFSSYRQGETINEKIEKYMPLSYIWSENERIIGSVASKGEVLDVITGEIIATEIVRKTEKTLEIRTDAYCVEKNNRRYSLENFLSNVIK